MSSKIFPYAMYTLKKGDCLELMDAIPDGSVDMVLCDLPYGTTQNKWDSVIPLGPLWAAYERVCKPNAAIVLTATQPFSSFLTVSGIREFKYEWIWRKSKITGVLNAKKMPVRCHEAVLVFSFGSVAYNPQGLVAHGKVTKQGGSSRNYGKRSSQDYMQEYTNYPRDVLDIASEGGGKCTHPTKKPTALCEYLVRTYTNEGDLVLDNTMGSGTTGVACANTGRRFYGIELNDYFEAAEKRIQDAYWNKQLVLPSAADAFDAQW